MNVEPKEYISDALNGGHGIASAAPLMASPYFVNLDFFSGPLDLLLHLVHRQEVPIERVSMTLVADQYLEILSRFDTLDLNRLTEYLVVAATLVAIKSEAVLPKGNMDEFEDPEELRDPALLQELRERLRQYELTKQRAIALRHMPQLGVDTFIRPSKAVCADIPESDDYVQHDSYGLGQMFVGLLHRIGQGATTMRIHIESVSVVSYMMKIIDDLQGAFSGRQIGSLFDVVRNLLRIKTDAKVDGNVSCVNVTRSMIVGSFIAMLELCKRGVIRASQNGDNEDISVSLCEGFSSGSALDVFGKSVDGHFIDEKSINEQWGDKHLSQSNIVSMSDYVSAHGGATQRVTSDPTSQEEATLVVVNGGLEDSYSFKKEAQYG